jgi:hypothetical protein
MVAKIPGDLKNLIKTRENMMLSIREKNLVAAKVEQLLQSLNNPEIPADRPIFKLYIEGQPFECTNIYPNWSIKECKCKREAEDGQAERNENDR